MKARNIIENITIDIDAFTEQHGNAPNCLLISEEVRRLILLSDMTDAVIRRDEAVTMERNQALNRKRIIGTVCGCTAETCLAEGEGYRVVLE